MIEKYKIKNIDGEDVLYVYLNFDYEFSKINFFDDIKNYFNNFKIKFNGKKIVLVTAGIAFATLLLNVPNNIEDNSYNNYDYNYVSSIIFKNYDENFNITNEDTFNINKTEEIKNNIQTNNNENSEYKENIKFENNSEVKENVKVETNSEKKEDVNIENTIKDKVELKENENNIKNESSIENNATIVTVYRSNGKILKIELEEYIIGVVAAEMPASFNIEALKAQSILSRTYALKTMKSDKKLTDTISTQVYKDNSQLKKIWGNSFDTYYNKIKKAVESTKGKTVKYNDEYIEAVYHSTSNGYTEESQNVWGNYFPYLVSVESRYDINVKRFNKSVNFSYDQISTKLGIILHNESSVEYIKNKSHRVETITIDGISFKGTEFRNKLGLRSTDFELIFNDNGITINTKGYGHGVGMSQYGANEMSKLGMTYKDIIHHYYKGVSIN